MRTNMRESSRPLIDIKSWWWAYWITSFVFVGYVIWVMRYHYYSDRSSNVSHVESLYIAEQLSSSDMVGLPEHSYVAQKISQLWIFNFILGNSNSCWFTHSRQLQNRNFLQIHEGFMLIVFLLSKTENSRRTKRNSKQGQHKTFKTINVNFIAESFRKFIRGRSRFSFAHLINFQWWKDQELFVIGTFHN